VRQGGLQGPALQGRARRPRRSQRMGTPLNRVDRFEVEGEQLARRQPVRRSVATNARSSSGHGSRPGRPGPVRNSSSRSMVSLPWRASVTTRPLRLADGGYRVAGDDLIGDEKKYWFHVDQARAMDASATNSSLPAGNHHFGTGLRRLLRVDRIGRRRSRSVPR
jgi:hypothetical protein